MRIDTVINRKNILSKKCGKRIEMGVFFGGYSLLFFTLCCISFIWFYKEGKSFLWKGDGLYQHYNALAYYGEYLRGIVSNIWNNQIFEVPLWDLSIGYGSDILTTLHYYVIGEPINLVSVFFLPEQTESLYNALVLIRLYLAGLSFLVYCMRMKKQKLLSVLGAVSYVFCGYSLHAAVRHPYFVTPMIFLPLIFIGIEKVFNKEKPYIFIISVFMSAISNFYFFYMLTIFMFLYAAIRFFFMNHEKWFAELRGLLGKFLIYYSVGLSMACIIFFPVVLQMLSTDRANAEIKVNLFHEVSYYAKMISGLISTISIGAWTHMGYVALVIPCIAALLVKYKEKKESITGLIILVVLMIFPAGGHVLNGFSYVSNRWIWAFSFLVIYIMVDIIPDILQITRKGTVVCVFLNVAYYLSYALLVEKGYSDDKIQLAFLAAYNIILLIGREAFRWNDKRRKIVVVSMSCILIFIVSLNIAANARYIYTNYGRNYVEQFHDNGSAQRKLTVNSNVVEYQEGEYYRYEQNPFGQTNMYNTEMQTGRYGTSYYFSLSDEYISAYLDENQVNIERDFQYIGLDGRAVMGTLAGVRYFEVIEGRETYLPYGYNKKIYSYNQENGDIINGYENQYVLPLGYTYDSYILEEEYDKLTVLEKQQALMQGAVIDKKNIGLEETQLSFSDKTIDYKIEYLEDIIIEDDKIIVQKENAEMRIMVDQVTEGEVYLCFKNLVYSDINPIGEISEEKWATMSWAREKYTRFKYNYWIGNNYAKLGIVANGVVKEVRIATPEYSWYSGNHDFTVNMGQGKNDSLELTVYFKSKGVYSFDDIEIVSQDMDFFVEQYHERNKEVLENVVVKTNAVRGNISLNQNKILCLSIPYSRGWKLYVNGEEKELYQINTMYMGTVLPEGYSEIELKYITPGIKVGVVLTLLGIFGFVIIIVYERRKRERKSDLSL